LIDWLRNGKVLVLWKS